MALIQSGSSTDLLKVDPTSNAARVTIYDPSGNLAASSHPSSKTIQNNATITTGGNALFTNLDSSAVALFINIQAAPTGISPTLTYTIAEVDPSDQATVVGQTITGSVLNSITTQTLFLSQIKSNTILISWILGGTNTPTFTRVNSVIVSQDGGNVTANIGNTNGLALDATLTSGTAKTQIYDGTNVIGTSAHPVRTDTTGTTTQPISGSVTANAGSGTFTVGGAVTANQGGTWTVQPGNTANTTPWLTTINQGGNSAIVSAGGALKVDGSGATQPISGTITANAGSGTFTVGGTVTSNIGTTNGLALDTTLTSGAAKFQPYDGTNVIGTSTHPVRTDPTGITTQPVSGTITANAGSGIFSVSGTVTSNQGTANSIANSWPVEMTDGTNILGVSAHPIRIDPTGTTTQPVSGTVTANAGSGTFAVSGTVTANIGTTNGLALDTSINGILVSQGSTTSGEKGALIQGAVTTSSPSYTTAQTSPLSLTTTGALRIDGSATTQPVSGTITANIGTTNGLALDATFTGGTAKTQMFDGTNVIGTAAHPIRIDPTGTTTQPISGTVTANIGTTNGLALDTSVNGILLSQGSTTSGEKGPIIQGAVTTVAPTYTTAQTSPLSLTIAGALRVDGSAVTQPISGTVTANQGGTWTVQPGNTANTTPWLTTINQGGNSATVTASNALKVDSSAVTQPISGTITANAGSGTFTVSGTVTSNIGTTNGLALDATLAKLTIAQSAVLDSNTQALVGGSVTTSAPTYTTGNINPLSLTTSGALRVDGSGATQPVSGTVTVNQGGAPWSENITQFGGTNISTGTGAGGVGIPRVTVSNDSNVLVTPPTLTKGTQGSTGFSTQDLKDSGRVVRIFEATGAASVTAEAMMTLTPLTDFVAGSTGTSFSVTAGKRLRIQSISIFYKTTAATALACLFRLRISSSGAVTTATAVAVALGIPNTAAIIGSIQTAFANFPDGLELSGTMQLGISQLSTVTTSVSDVTIIGYEY